MKEYIERAAVKALLRRYGATEHVMALIDTVPAADIAEVVRAKWNILNECLNEGVYCSHCKKKVYKIEYANQKLNSKYCPNCGAKMDKEDEDL